MASAMLLTLVPLLPLPLATAAQAPTLATDGVWGISEQGRDGEGANCDRWGTGPGDSPTAVSDSDPAVQNRATNDENHIRYGAQDVNGDPVPCHEFVVQSGFGFMGVQGSSMPTDGASFKLGAITHYNTTTNVDMAEYNPLENVGLTITLSGGVDAVLEYVITLEETPNWEEASECMFPDGFNDPPCGEKVSVGPQSAQTATIRIQGRQYTLEMMGFADCDVPGTPNNMLYTHEMAADEACLYARVVESS